MLIEGSRLIDTPVMGLQTGAELARTSKAIIDPQTLEVVAYELSGSLLDSHPSLLRIADIRELSDIGLIVDSSDEFVAPTDIIKLEKIYDLNFKLIGMSVVDKKKSKLGKVEDYILDTNSFIVQQLDVKRPLFKSLNDASLLVHRSQITEINNSAIVVNSETEDVPKPVLHAVRTGYVNPFRKSQGPQAEHIDQQD